MNNRVIDNRDELIQKGQSFVTQNGEREFQHKVELVLLVLKGFKVSDFARLNIVSQSALQSWVRSVVNTNSFESLRHLPITGRPSKLRGEEIDKLSSVIKENPKDYGYIAWDGNSIHDYIKKTFNQDICVRHCQRLKKSILETEK